MEAKAINRFVGTSPRKMRLVIDLIRGRGVEEALSVLHFVPKHAAKTAEKVLRSAISNLQNKDEAGRVETTGLIVKEAFVDGGPMQKRVLPAPMGRAFRVRKRSNHITIIVAQKEAAAQVSASAPKKLESKTKAVEPKKKTAESKTKTASSKTAAAG